MLEFLYIDDTRIEADSLETFARGLTRERMEVLAPVLTFLKEWWSEALYVTVQTSGSTGIPKHIKLEKSAMRRSALRSNHYFQITANQRLLLAMNLRYIGAKMMVVRAVMARAELVVVPPSSHPLTTLTEAPHFLSFVPLQLHHTLQVPAERELLCQSKQIIIGGGAIHPIIEDELSSLPISAYATYGMTETISHVALRQLNGPNTSPLFYPLDGVRLSTSEKGQLIIEDQFLYPEGPAIITNDLVELHSDGGFTIEGRADYMINSGGVKISPEKVERQLSAVLAVPLAISWVADTALGQKLVLVLESSQLPPTLSDTLQKLLPPYLRPKEIRLLPQLPHNGNGKLDRSRLHNILADID